MKRTDTPIQQCQGAEKPCNSTKDAVITQSHTVIPIQQNQRADISLQQYERGRHISTTVRKGQAIPLQ